MAEKFKKLRETLEEIRKMEVFNPPMPAGVTPPVTLSAQEKLKRLHRILREKRKAGKETTKRIGVTAEVKEPASERVAKANIELKPTTRPRARRKISDLDRKFREEVKRNQELYRQRMEQKKAREKLDRFLQGKISKIEGRDIPGFRKEKEPVSRAEVRLTNLEEIKKNIVEGFGIHQYPDRYKQNGKEKVNYIPYFNPGITVKTQDGAIVRPVAPGRVLFAASVRGYGPTVIVQNDNGYVTLYSGLDRNLNVRPGQRVTPNDVIGVVRKGSGMHGFLQDLDAPLLQFEVYWFDDKENMHHVNPLTYLRRLRTGGM